MNHKYIPAVAAFLIVGMLLSAIPLSYAQTTLAFGPKLDVVTIPQDDQVLGTGVMILGLQTAVAGKDLMSQHKLQVTYNGGLLSWSDELPGITVVCNWLEKDKVNVVPDPKTGKGQQGAYENLMTNLVDVSDHFVCKPRWKVINNEVWSVGVLDVYYTGPTTLAKNAGYFIADNIMVVSVYFTVGKTVAFGSEMQDICTLGWAVTGNAPQTAVAATFIITKPDGTQHYIWQNAMGNFVSCEALALAQRDVLGIKLPLGQDPLSTV